MAHAAAVFAVTEPVVAALLWRAKELALVVGVTNVVFVAVTLSCRFVGIRLEQWWRGEYEKEGEA